MDPQSNSLLAQLGQSPSEANLQALRAHCQQIGDTGTLAVGLATFAHAQQDPALAAETLTEAGGLQLHHLHDPRQARPLFERALAHWPTYRPALDGLRGALHQVGDYEALCGALERYAHALAEVDGDPVELGTLHLELGNLHRDRFERLDRAVAHYRAAVDYDAAQREALRSAREIYRQAGKWDSVSKLLALEAESFPDGHKKAVLLSELAAIYRDQLRDLPAAQQALEEAEHCLPEDLGIKHQLALVHLDQADLAPGTPAAHTHNARGADILATMAESVDDQYALAYTEAALDAAPSHARALAAYERVARRTGRGADIPARWKRALAASPSGGEARRIRLALSRELISTGEPSEARACLDPLLRAGDPDARALIHPGELPAEPELLDESVLEPLDDDGMTEGAPPDDAPLNDALVDSFDEETTPALTEDSDAGETTQHTPMSKSDAAKALSASLEEALSEADLEEMTGERTPVSMVPPSELARLHEALHEKRRANDREGAAETARQVLEHAPVDPTAVTTLEEHYRAERRFEELRDLVLHLSRQLELPIDARIQRLREASFLSETKLDDVEGAASALAAVLSLVPSDEVALGKLRSLYEKHERWNELTQLVERQAATLVDPQAQVEAYRELVSLHRDKRNHTDDAIDALRYLRDLEPDEPAHEDALAELLVRAGRDAEAVPMLEAKLLRLEEPEARCALQLQLADIYEQQLGELDKAYELARAALHHRPDDDALLDRLLTLDETLERHDRLVDDLRRKLPRLSGEALAHTHARIAALAAEQLGDVDLACTHYNEALMLRPGEEALWDAARGVFESSGREEELNALLQRQAEGAENDAVASLLWRRLSARRAAEGNLSAAIDALHQLAERTPDDLEVQSELVDLLEQHGARPEDLIDQLSRLATLSGDAGHRRELRMRRVEILREDLVEPRRARDELLALVDEDPGDEEALRLLSDLCTDLDDARGLSSALLRQLGVGSVEAQLEVAERLAKLAEEELEDSDLARTALRAWAELSPGDPVPLARMLPHLADPAHAADKVAAHDALAKLSLDRDESVEHLLEAAALAEQALGDVEGAWRRLARATLELGHVAAEAPLRELAERHQRGEALAEIFVALAQKEDEAPAKLRRWMDAAEAYEKLAGNQPQALEATLRALALDLDNVHLLDEADRLAGETNAWERLSKVYDSLARKAQTSEGRVRVLTRHAQLLEERAADLDHALDRLIAACALTPTDDALLERALRLADRTDRDADVLPVYERRAELASAGSERARALLAACSLAHRRLEGGERSKAYLKRALREALDADALLDELERATAELDELDAASPDGSLLDALCDAYEDAVETLLPTPERAARLLQRAARLRGDASAATATLTRAFEHMPSDAELLDELASAAERAGEQESLAAKLRKLADDAIDSETASLVLRRLGSVLMDALSRPSEAADVFKQLVLLRPADDEGRARLRECLREAERHQELLVAIDQHLSRTDDTTLRVELLREAARCWQDDLGNRFEARAAWQKLLSEAPGDAEGEAAFQALARRKPDGSDDDGELLESGLVVLPEDLTHEEAARPAEPQGGETAEGDLEQAAVAPQVVPAGEAPTDAAPFAEDDHEPSDTMESRVDAHGEQEAAQIRAADADPVEGPDTLEQPLDEEQPSAASSAESASEEEGAPVLAEPLDDDEVDGTHAEAVDAESLEDVLHPDTEEQALDADALVEELELQERSEPDTGVFPSSAGSRPPSMPPPPPPSMPPAPAEPLEDPMEALARLTPSDDEDDEAGEDEAVAVEQSSVVGPHHAADARPDDLEALSALVHHERPRTRSRIPAPPRGRNSAAPPSPPSRSPSAPSQRPTGGPSVPPPPPKRR